MDAPITTYRLAKIIDHTLLKPTATTSDFERLFDEALEYRFWSVCVPPSKVALASARLRGSGVKVCAVVGFPLGFGTPTSKAYEAETAIEDGADEIDMVMNIGAFRSGDRLAVERDIEGVSSVCRKSGRLLKVIIECCYLTDSQKSRAARISARLGAGYVKTSTGFGTGGATVKDVALLKRSLRGMAKVKASGGIGTLPKALAMVRAGADRIGTSSGVQIMKELARQETLRKK
jgi:deoxyribose-phosphate aldolase